MGARWALPLATLLAGVLLIGAQGAVLPHRAGDDEGDPPLQMPGLPSAALEQDGLTLRGAVAPPYCRLVNGLSDRWLTFGVVGCPVAERQATRVARQGQGPRARVQASALAWASQPANPRIGRRHLVWAVALQNAPPPGGIIVCPILRGTTPPCLGARGIHLVLVDATTGRALPASNPGAPLAGPWLPHT